MTRPQRDFDTERPDNLSAFELMNFLILSRVGCCCCHPTGTGFLPFTQRKVLNQGGRKEFYFIPLRDGGRAICSVRRELRSLRNWKAQIWYEKRSVFEWWKISRLESSLPAQMNPRKRNWKDKRALNNCGGAHSTISDSASSIPYNIPSLFSLSLALKKDRKP